MVLTDTHTHLYYETDPLKREQLMQRSLEKGVSRLFLPNVDTESLPLLFGLADAFPAHCFPMLGLHPCHVREDWQQQLERIRREIESRRVSAIGEIGIDLYWEQDSLPRQIEAFRSQLQWAKSLHLPVSIHCRNAFPQVIAVLEEEKAPELRGILHCFTGDLAEAQRLIALGFFLGIGGVVTYKNAGLDRVVRDISLHHIVLETDTPYLAPVPYRGKPNESSYLPLIAERVADLHETDVETVARLTTANSRTIFGC